MSTVIKGKTIKKFLTPIDPAPSQLRYKLQRLWLRRGLRIITLLFITLIVLFTLYRSIFFSPFLHEKLNYLKRFFIEEISFRPEILISSLQIDTELVEVLDQIRAVLQLSLPVSFFDIEVEELQKLVEKIDAVESARIWIREDGVLSVYVKERKPAVIFRVKDELMLLDRDGERIGEIFSRSDRTDLPIILGKSGDLHVEEALRLIIAFGNSVTRTRGLIYVGERRWNIELNNKKSIYLPEQNPMEALDRVLALHKTLQILDLPVSIIDMRDPARPNLGFRSDQQRNTNPNSMTF